MSELEKLIERMVDAAVERRLARNDQQREPLYIKAAEFAARNSIALSTVREAIADGRLQPVKRIGRAVRIAENATIAPRAKDDVIRMPRRAAASGGDLVPFGAAPEITDEKGLRRRGSNRSPTGTSGALRSVSATEHEGDGPPTSMASGEKAPKLGAIRSACDLGLAALRAAATEDP